MRRLIAIFAFLIVQSAFGGSILSVAPDTAYTGEVLWVTITGDQTQFGQGSGTIVSLEKSGGPTIGAGELNVVSTTSIEAYFSIPSEADTGRYDVVVQEDPIETVVLPEGFHVYVNTCGDMDGLGGFVDIDDWVYLIEYLFDGGPEPVGFADVDLCDDVNLADAVYIINYIFGGGPAPCYPDLTCDLPVGNSSIDLGCPLEVNSPDGDSIPLPIYFTNDSTLAGISLGLGWDSDDIEITSVDFTGSILDQGTPFIRTYFPGNNTLLMLWTIVGLIGQIEPQTGGLLATLWVQIPEGTPNQVVDIYIEFVPPGGETIFCPLLGGTIGPEFNDCGAADIVISGNPPIVCGDVNCSGDIDIDDIIYMVNYVFQAGPVPCAGCPK
jgi:hypothetical protein